MDVLPLSKRLRAATAEAHRTAERHSFVVALLRGEVTAARYAEHLSSLLLVYETLESALTPPCHLALVPVASPAMFRAAAIRADLAVLGGETPPSPAARRWAEHLQRRQATSPLGLVGHIYTRYLGDLSGGQQIGRRLVSTGGLPAEAVATYRFDDIDDISAFKDDFRAALDRIGAEGGGAVCEDIVVEARRAFEWSGALFEAVSPAAPTRSAPGG